MRAIIFFSILLIFSCGDMKLGQTKDVDVSPGHILVTTSMPDPDETQALNQVGLELWREFNINLNTNNKNYFLYSAVVQYPYGKDWDEANLLSFNSFSSCFIYELCTKQDTFFYEREEKNYKLIFDHRMNNFLDDENIYFSMNGKDVQKIETRGALGSWESFDKEKTEIFIDTGPVNLFRAELHNVNNSMDTGEEAGTFLQIGFLSHDVAQPVDFNAYFNSPGFKKNVGVDMNSFEVEEKANWLNYIKNDEEILN